MSPENPTRRGEAGPGPEGAGSDLAGASGSGPTGNEGDAGASPPGPTGEGDTGASPPGPTGQGDTGASRPGPTGEGLEADPHACDACLRRTRLVALLSPHIELARHDGTRLPQLLSLGEDDLLAALAGRRRPELEAQLAGFSAEAARRRCAETRLVALCRHDAAYPQRLADDLDAPAVLHVRGRRELVGFGAEAPPAVAVVGARRATAYGLEVARALGRDLAAAGIVVVSGMALGVDAATHEGALAAGGATVAVLGGGADVPYPATKRRLHARLSREGCVVSELPPGFTPRRWSFPARNRIIAALTEVTVVVEGGERSGSLITADIAMQLGRVVGAVPGPVTAPTSAGPNALLADGAQVVRDARDVLDLVFGAGESAARSSHADDRLPDALRPALAAVDAGHDTPGALGAVLGDTAAATVALTRLELAGALRRDAGGRYLRRL